MIKFLKITGITGIMLAAGVSFAAQPMWVIQTLKSIRHAIKISKAGRQAAVVLGKGKHSLPDSKIAELALIASRKGGLKTVGKILGSMKLPLKYTDRESQLVLQDTYLRIAVKNGHISHALASEALKKLHNTPGLTGLLSKINSVSPAQVKGHLQELQIALCAKRKGFQVVSLGQKFADGIKGGDTDLDILLMRDGVKYAIESKAYTGMIPDSMARADAQSLIAFCKKIKKTVPVFCFESEPSLFTKWYLENQGIKFFCGTPEAVITKLELISPVK